MHKYDNVIDPGVNLKSHFLSLSYFQQWVLFSLYSAKQGNATEPRTAERLIMETCLSSLVDNFSEEVAKEELKFLVKKGLAEFVLPGKGYKITINGIILVKQASAAVYRFTRGTGSVATERIHDSSVKKSLQALRDDKRELDNDGVVKTMVPYFLSNIGGWSQLLSILLSIRGI